MGIKTLRREKEIGMKIFIIYKDGDNFINELCLKDVNLSQANILIPHIGETFIDRVNNVEYEVKDIVRTYSNKEYGVQVMLQRREARKYHR